MLNGLTIRILARHLKNLRFLSTEEEMKRLQASRGTGGSEIGFQYDEYNPADPTGAAALEAAKKAKEEEEALIPYKPIEKLRFPPDTIMPKWMKEHAVIEKTAMFVWTQGPQMEIVIKAKQSANRQFDFLNMEHPLNSYYRYLLKLMKEKKYVPPRPPPPEAKKEPEEDESSDDEGGGFALHPSLMGRVQNKADEAAVRTPDRELNYKLGDTNDVYSQLFKKLSAITPKAPPRPPTPPPPQPTVNSRNVEGARDSPALLAETGDFANGNHEDMDEGQDGYDEAKMLEWYQLSTGVDFNLLAQSAVPPPPDLQPIVDRLAEYVAKNGAEFEVVVRKRQDRNFDFINPGHAYHGYYQMKIAQVAYKEYVQQVFTAESAVTSTTSRMSSSPVVSVNGSVQSATAASGHSDAEHSADEAGDESSDGEKDRNEEGANTSPRRIGEGKTGGAEEASVNKANPISFALKSAPKKKVPVPSEEITAKLQGGDSDEDFEDEFGDDPGTSEMKTTGPSTPTTSHDPSDPIAVLTSKNPELYRKHSDILFKLHQMKHSLKLKPVEKAEPEPVPVSVGQETKETPLDSSFGAEEEDDEAEQLRIFMLQAADRLKQIQSKKKPSRKKESPPLGNVDIADSHRPPVSAVSGSPAGSIEEIPPDDPLTDDVLKDLNFSGSSSNVRKAPPPSKASTSSRDNVRDSSSPAATSVWRKSDQDDPLKNAVQTARRKKAAMFLSLLKTEETENGSTATNSVANSACGSPGGPDHVTSSGSSSRSTSSEPEESAAATTKKTSPVLDQEPSSKQEGTNHEEAEETKRESLEEGEVDVDMKEDQSEAKTEGGTVNGDKPVEDWVKVKNMLDEMREGGSTKPETPNVKPTKMKSMVKKVKKKKKKVISMFDEDSGNEDSSGDSDDSGSKSRSRSKHKSSSSKHSAATGTASGFKKRKHRSKRKSSHSGDEGSSHKHKKSKKSSSAAAAGSVPNGMERGEPARGGHPDSTPDKKHKKKRKVKKQISKKKKLRK